MQIAEKSFDSFIEDFRKTKSHIHLDTIQKDRAAFSILDVEEGEIHQTVWHKSNRYNTLGKCYIKKTLKALFAGERVNRSVISKLRYRLMSMATFNSIFNRRIDIFNNGIKLNSDEVMIALFDNSIILEIRDNLIDTNIRIISRPYHHDITLRGNIANVNVMYSDIVGAKNNEYIVFRDGLIYTETSSTILPSKTGFIIKLAQPATRSVEVIFIKGIISTNISNFDRGLIDIDPYVGHEHPVHNGNILSFDTHGKLIDLMLEPITSTTFKSDISSLDRFKMWVIYNIETTDNGIYTDNMLWYINKYKNDFYDNIDSIGNLPDFVKEFKLFIDDININDYVSSDEHTVLNDYYKSKAHDIIKYDDELISTLYDTVYVKTDQSNKVDVHMTSFSIVDGYIDDNTRLDTSKESLDNITKFPTAMVMFKLHNPEKKIFNVYLDGIRLFVHSHRFNYNNYDYVYIMKRVLLNRGYNNITFEVFSSKSSSPYIIPMHINSTAPITIPNFAKSSNEDRIINDTKIVAFNVGGGVTEYVGDVSSKYNTKDDAMTLSLPRKPSVGRITKIVDANFVKVYSHETKKRGEGIILTLTGFELVPYDPRYYRVFKNGRQIPRSNYTITFDNIKNVPIINIDVNYTVYELIEVEYTPVIFDMMTYDKGIEPDGKIDLIARVNQNTPTKKMFFNSSRNKIILNGRYLFGDTIKKWCNRGLTLHNTASLKHLEIHDIYNDTIDNICKPYYDKYKDMAKLFSKFVVTTMVGGPCSDTESDCTDVNIERTGEMYYDLYREFLKHNIVSFGDRLPEYIAFKYGGLVDTGLNNTIMVNAEEEQLYWMPLDATMEHEQQMVEIMGLYYELLDDIASLQVIDPNNIPPELLEKYEELFENNVLVVQVPVMPNM